jgi:hypothetical protein
MHEMISVDRRFRPTTVQQPPPTIDVDMAEQSTTYWSGA